MVEKQCVKDGYWYREMDGSEVFNLGWISRVKNMYTKATVIIPEPTLYVARPARAVPPG